MPAALQNLSQDGFLRVGDYLTSPAGLFYAMLQPDGDFCVFYGQGPDQAQGKLWCASQLGLQPNQNLGPYYAIMQSDGNFCIYYGKDPDSKVGTTGLWCASQAGLVPDSNSKLPYSAILQDNGDFCVTMNGKTVLWRASQANVQLDPIESITVKKISYMIVQGEITHTYLLDLYKQSAINTTETTQSTIISGVSPTPDTSMWIDTILKPSPSRTPFKTNIPFVSNGKIITSSEVAIEFDWQDEVEHPGRWSYNVPVVVPPNKNTLATISVKIVSIHVPFTLNATVTLKSSKSFNIDVSGTYFGRSADDLSVSFRSVSLNEFSVPEQ